MFCKSPGKLPNSLTVQQIKYGTSIARNPILAGFCSYIMKYRGIGSGINRAIQEQPNLEIINDRVREEFKVIIKRGLSLKNITEGKSKGVNEAINSPFEIIQESPDLNSRQLSEKKVTPQVNQQVSPQVKKLIKSLNGENSRKNIQKRLKISDREYFRKKYLVLALEQGFIEMTQPDSPSSPTQKYRLTEKGKKLIINKWGNK